MQLLNAPKPCFNKCMNSTNQESTSRCAQRQACLMPSLIHGRGAGKRSRQSERSRFLIGCKIYRILMSNLTSTSMIALTSFYLSDPWYSNTSFCRYTFNTVIHSYAKAGGAESASKAQELLQRMQTLYQEGNVLVKPDTISTCHSPGKVESEERHSSNTVIFCY